MNLSVTTYIRGHPCEYTGSVRLLGKWVYSDSKIPIGEEVRPCKRCGKMPTPEGYDACLGYLSGVKSACCGHGMEDPILMFE